ncbi:hypothetical protein FPOAC2_03676 [Fusarium poae]|jgi:hypothetical protein|uniref:hypothetical protein n=1 Tax=Fusarium poae TaxID=36050 RepID=UPI001CE774C8|nr:hypothetical protein FPOAC1_003571 [Fusarium poae]KAG8677548.1 hypothetical protein FPOAC1_003571 [Fusarium poae]
MSIQRTFFILLTLLFLVFIYDSYGPELEFSTPNFESERELEEHALYDARDGYCADTYVNDFGTTYFPRSQFVGTHGAIVTGWPAKGGYYKIKCSLAELDFLGLDRYNPTNRSENVDEEEAWCATLRQLRAKYYRNICDRIADGAYGIETPKVYIGWPTDGGVWALQATKLNATLRGLGRIENAFTMEERWQKIKEYGGTFYAEPKECPYLDLDGSKDPVIKKPDCGHLD